jgi:hypothetical protein
MDLLWLQRLSPSAERHKETRRVPSYECPQPVLCLDQVKEVKEEGATETEVEDLDARERIAVLEEKANRHSNVIAMLQAEVTQLSTDFGRSGRQISVLRSAAAGIQTL